MLRLMVQLLQGYRSCLTLVRIHPAPFITFHKAAFLGLRNLGPDAHFMVRFLDCMFFSEFVMSRGPPWRRCDVFDELYAVMGEQLAAEAADPRKVLLHIKALAKELYDNENSTANFSSAGGGQGWGQRIPLPTEGHMMRVHQPAFPLLDAALVQQVISEGLAKRSDSKSNCAPVANGGTSSNSSQFKLVPMGQRDGGGLLGGGDGGPGSHLTNRRLEVLRSCITNIFENKISDAKKSFPAVMRTLKSKVRLYLFNPRHFDVDAISDLFP
jgi:myotubularin-related protein 5/13